MTDTPSASPRLVLVTGASRGIGRAAALELARQGNIVIAVARSKAALQKLDDEIRAFGSEAVLVPMDLKDTKGIETLGKVIGARARLRAIREQARQMQPEHRRAAARRRDDVIESIERLYHIARDAGRDVARPRIVSWLAATGLATRHYHPATSSFEQGYGGEADARPEEIDQAGDE